jgi:hypothetical protein
MTLERVSAISFELDIVDIWDSSDLLSCTVTAIFFTSLACLA